MPNENTAIGWTDDSWNAEHGCFKVSEGCANCYAARGSQRWGHTESSWTLDNASENIQMQAHHLANPIDKSPRRIFVNSVSDLFLPEEFLSDDYLREIFDVMHQCPQHAFQGLTKHGCETSDHHGETPRLLRWDEEYGEWPDNLWMGVSVENANRAYRIDQLRQTGAATKWVSFEPLVGPVGDVDLEGIDWVVIGGESGPADRRREMDHAWAREIRDQAKELDLPVFFKQSSAAKPEQGKRLAEEGATLQEAADLGAETTAYRELPELPTALREERPDLADQEVPADA